MPAVSPILLIGFVSMDDYRSGRAAAEFNRLAGEEGLLGQLRAVSAGFSVEQDTPDIKARDSTNWAEKEPVRVPQFHSRTQLSLPWIVQVHLIFAVSPLVRTMIELGMRRLNASEHSAKVTTIHEYLYDDSNGEVSSRPGEVEKIIPAFYKKIKWDYHIAPITPE